jgi:hypothetical protein
MDWEAVLNPPFPSETSAYVGPLCWTCSRKGTTVSITPATRARLHPVQNLAHDYHGYHTFRVKGCCPPIIQRYQILRSQGYNA